MLGDRIKDGVINRALIGIDDGAIFNVFKKKMAHIVLRHIRHDFSADTASALHHRDDGDFIGVFPIARQCGWRITWTRFSAYKSLIHFADASRVAEFLSVRIVVELRRSQSGA